MTNKFEQMLERLINEDREGAEELFHEIVVERSREIYEGLLESDLEIDETEDEEVDETADEEVEEAADDDDDDEEMDEGFDLDEFEVEADDDMGGDPADDMMADLGMDDGEDDMDMDDGEDEGDEELEDRVVDLEDALDDLKAEFEKMMAGDEGEDDMDMDMDMGADDDESEEEPEEEAFAFEAEDDDDDDDEEVDETADEDVEEAYKKKSKKSDTEQMREYVEKIAGGGLDAQKIGGDNGANAKSPVAGKNDMGGTTANIVRGDTANDGEAGAGSKVKGSALNDQNPKEDSAGNVNVPGGKAGKSMKAMPKGHGAEKKGTAPEKAGAESPINGVSTRAK